MPWRTARSTPLPLSQPQHHSNWFVSIQQQQNHSTLLGGYWIASARCAGPMSAAPARSAIVCARLSTRW
jgi:hypothetical protein